MATFLLLNFLGIVYFVYKAIIFKVGEQYTEGKYKDIGVIMLLQTGTAPPASCLLPPLPSRFLYFQPFTVPLPTLSLWLYPPLFS